MADADIEALLEAPYKKEAVPSKDKSDGEDSDQKSKRKHKKKHSRSSRSRSRSRSPKRRSRSPKRHSRSPRRRRSRSHSPRRRRSSPHYGGGGGGGNRRDSRGGYYRGRDDRDRGGGFRGGGANLQEASPKVSGPSESEEEPSSPGPDLTQEERDARTVLCMQLSARVTKKALKQLFQQVGKVTDVKMISDKNSRRPKGIAYVEFRELESVHKALNLNGQRIEGIPIVIQPSMAEKNRMAEAAARFAQPSAFKRVYVGSLHFNINEAMLKAIFEPFGTIDSVTLIRDSETQRSKGYGFIEYCNPESAKRAMEQMNGFELAGRPIKVGQVTEKGETGAYGLLDDDDADRGGIEMSSTSRAALMAKLSGSHGAGLSVPPSSAPPAAAASALAAPPSQLASPCFMLTNMFDPSNETDPHWELDIRDDVLEECSKYGSVVHIYVDKSSKGNVYVKTKSTDAAQSACKALHGRFFAGKMVTAHFMPEINYHTMFPQAMAAAAPLKPSSE